MSDKLQKSNMRRRQMVKKTAKSKGYAALGSAATTVLLTFLISSWMLLPGLPITAWLTYRWFQHRAEWGLRF